MTHDLQSLSHSGVPLAHTSPPDDEEPGQKHHAFLSISRHRIFGIPLAGRERVLLRIASLTLALLMSLAGQARADALREVRLELPNLRLDPPNLSAATEGGGPRLTAQQPPAQPEPASRASTRTRRDGFGFALLGAISGGVATASLLINAGQSRCGFTGCESFFEEEGIKYTFSVATGIGLSSLAGWAAMRIRAGPLSSRQVMATGFVWAGATALTVALFVAQLAFLNSLST